MRSILMRPSFSVASLLVLTVSLLCVQTRAQEPPAVSRSCFALGQRQVCIDESTYRTDVCTAIATYARHWSLPVGFFARLIWQESRFDPAALSPAGAQGIAQFVPGTARLRRLVDPFDPAEALARSAEYLRFLKDKFGNLGLAAAAYNGGEGRIGRYVAGGGGTLPLETRSYVLIVTGHGVDRWLTDPPADVDYTLDPNSDFEAACLDMARAVQTPDFTTSPAEWQPWGVLIAQTASADLARMRFDRAVAQFEDVLGGEQLMLITVRNPNFGGRLRFSAMVGRQSRAEADGLCDELLAAGGNCIVQKNESAR
ncbi:MAG TPA: lytic transglycosylase domain-containing protein [Devosia sp.]|jgi:hypothetical protein|nr:lytic transglycosylase domain-containing protein [Devosia sp.]